MTDVDTVEDWCTQFTNTKRDVETGREPLTEQETAENTAALAKWKEEKSTGKLPVYWTFSPPNRGKPKLKKSFFNYNEAYGDDRKMLATHLQDKPEFYLTLGDKLGILGIAVNSKRMAFFFWHKGFKLQRCTTTLVERVAFIKSFESRIEQEYCSDRCNLFLLTESLSR